MPQEPFFSLGPPVHSVRTRRTVTPLALLILSASPLVSSMARSSMVKPLEVTCRPAGPVFWFLKERVVHIQAAFRHFDDGAGFGGDQGLLELLLKIGAGGEAGILFRAGDKEGKTQRGGEQGGSGLGHEKLLGHGVARD